MSRGEHFMKLYLATQPRLYGYVISLVPNWSDVDDIVQETSSLMWAKFDQFELGTDFAAWALTIARFQVMAYRQTHCSRQRRFSDEAAERIEELVVLEIEKEDARRYALRRCLGKLKDNDRVLLNLKYQDGVTMKDVTVRTGQNLNTLYKALNRIHTVLLQCIRRTIKYERA